MDFDSPDVMKDFPGLYASELNKKCNNDSDYSDETEKGMKKDMLIGKRKDKKDKKDKERGYAALEGESSDEKSKSRSYSISPINQLLLPLHFYATGGFLLTVADTLKVSKSSVSKIIKKVSFAIAALAPRYIKLRMNEAEPTEAKASFFEKATLPRIIGSLDCTHVKIQSPGGNNAELFRNRKGYFSINVQIISSTNLRILNIVARWPGSSHDQTIFDSSSIKQRLLNNEFGNSW